MWDKAPDQYSLKNSSTHGRILSYREAIREALAIALRDDRRVVLLGEGIDDAAGVFGTTAGLQQQFGADRVMDTPVCENALTGISLGSALAGLRPVLIHMRTDFMLMSMDQLVNHVAKWKYMFGGSFSVPLVIRAIIGGGWGSAAQHSQPLQALFCHTPGLKVVMPATAYDAKGLLLGALSGNSPVIFIEHRWLYDQRCPVPEKAYRLPIGAAQVVRKGRDITLVCDSIMASMALECSEKLSAEGISAEIIDLRTVKPLDTATVVRSVKKTGRCLVMDFGYSFCGISAEVAAMAGEKAFGSLKAGVARLGLPDCPAPASPVLEKAYYPSRETIIRTVRSLVRTPTGRR
jgi:acetoin:2,6-dichlorophenolindophenol oxidoreductase subunit beta